MPIDDWAEANRRHLLAALAAVRGAMREAAGAEAVEAPADLGPGTPAPGQAPWALEALAKAFGLSDFERGVLLLCAGVELDAGFADDCLGGRGDGAAFPSFGQAMAGLPGAHWSALTPDAPLRHWRLVELLEGGPLARSRLRIDERILHHLTGLTGLDERLRALLAPVPAPDGPLPGSLGGVADRAIELWSGPTARSPLPVLLLGGEAESGKRTVASATAGALGLPLFAIRAEDIPAAAADRESLARLCDREVLLGGMALLVECDHDADPPRPLIAFAERIGASLLVSCRDPIRPRGRPVARLDVALGDAPEQAELWRRALGPIAGRLVAEVDRLVAQFRLDPGTIAEVADSLAGDPTESGDRLWDACRARSRDRLEGLAARVEGGANWDDLVLPEPLTRTLREIAVHVRRRPKVHHEWGFAARGSRGLGLTALFAGASGTGKTLAAEVIATDLRLDLYRVDLSQVVSKYIGETEKNLRRVFDAADEGGAILLFDEADALFGKRSEVKDSHDRHANIEVGYLLQRMETYRGLAILTTNMKTSLDAAFLRRLRFIADFPYPDAAQRAGIWRRAFPAATPTQGLDPDRLARLNLAGGNIQNIALHAAFLAADADQPVQMSHLRAAAEAEFARLERPWSDEAFRGP